MEEGDEGEEGEDQVVDVLNLEDQQQDNTARAALRRSTSRSLKIRFT